MNLLNIRERLAEVLGCKAHEVDEAMRDEQGARRALGRRGFLAAAAAIAAAPALPEKLISIPEPAGVIQFGNMVWTYGTSALDAVAAQYHTIRIAARWHVTHAGQP